MEVTAQNVDDSAFWSSQDAADYVNSLFLMESPIIVVSILGAYLLFVLKLGPAYMKTRPAFKLRKLIIFYNMFQVAFSLYLASYGIHGIWDLGFFRKDCITTNRDPFKRMAFGHNLYFIAKLTELLDTVFFILRKKWNQVSFLHVYHHSIMYTASWVVLKYEPTYSLVFLGTLNSFVHIIMYAYYALSAFPRLRKYLWWKKYITKIQLIQFLTIMIQIQVDSYTTQCPTTYILRWLCYVHGVLFIYLFTDFYIKSYKQKQRETTLLREQQEINKDGNTFDAASSKVSENSSENKSR